MCILACRSRSTGWPAARGFLLLQLLTRLFPTADRKHRVCTALARLLGFLLLVCPFHRPCNVAAALFCAALLQQIASAGQRYAPEVTPVAEALLQSAVKAKHRAARRAAAPCILSWPMLCGVRSTTSVSALKPCAAHAHAERSE